MRVRRVRVMMMSPHRLWHCRMDQRWEGVRGGDVVIAFTRAEFTGLRRVESWPPRVSGTKGVCVLGGDMSDEDCESETSESDADDEPLHAVAFPNAPKLERWWVGEWVGGWWLVKVVAVVFEVLAFNGVLGLGPIAGSVTTGSREN